jgi:hypothetical protein
MTRLMGQPLWHTWLLASAGPGMLETSGQGTAGTGIAGGTGDSPNDSLPGAGRELGPIGTASRLVAGLLLVGSVVFGQLETHHVRPATWALGVVGFPVLVLTWHWWRIRRTPARFHDSSPLSYALGVLLFLALYLTWWYAPAISVASDAALIFFGGSMLLAALRGEANCEVLALSNWLLRRQDQIACAVFAPIDALERRWARP